MAACHSWAFFSVQVLTFCIATTEHALHQAAMRTALHWLTCLLGISVCHIIAGLPTEEAYAYIDRPWHIHAPKILLW